MNTILNQDQNGVIWVKNEDSQIFGIVSVNTITDEDGLPYGAGALEVLENAGFELNQDWENESTYLEFVESNGEVCRVVFSGDELRLLDNDQVNA